MYSLQGFFLFFVSKYTMYHQNNCSCFQFPKKLCICFKDKCSALSETHCRSSICLLTMGPPFQLFQHSLIIQALSNWLVHFFLKEIVCSIGIGFLTMHTMNNKQCQIPSTNESIMGLQQPIGNVSVGEVIQEVGGGQHL